MKMLRLLPAIVLSTLFSAAALAGCTSSTVGVGTHPQKRAVGAACAFDDQCDSSRCSGDPIAGTCGACVAVQALGESCTGPNEGCSPSAVCDDGVCRSTRKLAGEACGLEPKGGDRHECDDELYCAPLEGAFTMGTCTARIALGGACVGYIDGCVRGAQCGTSNQCEPIPTEGCTHGSGCAAGTHCGVDAKCYPSTLQEGDRCGIVDGSIVDDACVAGLVCGSLAFPDGGGGSETITTCLPLPIEGEPCISGGCAEGLFCRHLAYDGVTLPRCERPRNEGEACRSDNAYRIDCAEGLECRANACRIACH